MAVQRILAGLSTRRHYTAGPEPVGRGVEEEGTGTSKGARSRRFDAMSRNALEELVGWRLDNLELVALIIDGVQVGEHLFVVPVGIDADRPKHPEDLKALAAILEVDHMGARRQPAGGAAGNARGHAARASP